MTDLPGSAVDPKLPVGPATGSVEEEKVGHTGKLSLWSDLFGSNFSIFESHSGLSSSEKKLNKSRTNGWSTGVRKIMSKCAMRRLQERILGASRVDMSSSNSEIWLLGSCYKALPEESSSRVNHDNDLVAFLEDFSSRIWITYRKGFGSIGDSKYTSDVGWGCMIRSSQMLVAQALIFHHLGRAWRKPSEKPNDPEYIEILSHFGDSEACKFSIHNLIRAGKGYGLAAGSWVGPYAMCRTWETIARANGGSILPMPVYIVSGDEDGARGGAPVVYIDVASKLCSEFNSDVTWSPILLLVPLLLGLDKVNPRYIPLLQSTFMFPQSLGILGGRPGASTYLIGIQNDKAIYLDPHEVQQVDEINKGNVEADTSSYHCSTVRNMGLDQIDPSLAIAFYCRDEDDFKNFCLRASELGERSGGAPLFTIAGSCKPFDSRETEECKDNEGEDDWQLL